MRRILAIFREPDARNSARVLQDPLRRSATQDFKMTDNRPTLLRDTSAAYDRRFCADACGPVLIADSDGLRSPRHTI